MERHEERSRRVWWYERVRELPAMLRAAADYLDEGGEPTQLYDVLEIIVSPEGDDATLTIYLSERRF